MLSTIFKIFSFFEKSQKKYIYFIFFIVLLSMLMETLTIGLFLPLVSTITNPESFQNFQYLNKILESSFFRDYPPNLLFIYFFLIVYILRFFILLFCNWYNWTFEFQIRKYLTERLYKNYISMPFYKFFEFNSAFLLKNINNEISIFSAALRSVIMLMTEVAVFLGIFILLVILQPKATISLIFIFGSIGILINYFTKKKLNQWGEKSQINDGLRIKNFLQSFNAIKEIKIFGKENFFHNRMEKFNRIFFDSNKKEMFIRSVPRLILEIILIIGICAFLIFMIVNNQNLINVLPALALFGAAAYRVLPSINRIITSSQKLIFTVPVIDNLSNEFKKHFEKDLENSKIEIKFFDKSIDVENISYHYPSNNANIIDNQCFSIPKGKSIGIMGESGSGKSTLINILVGLLSPTKGKIKIDNVDLKKIEIKSYQKLIGYVPQQTYLLDETLVQNIVFGVEKDKINYDYIKKIIQIVKLEDLVTSLPDGIETIVGERGIKLSGGQIQRIGIARALYIKPKILILDEATNALDNETEKQLITNLGKLENQITKIIVSHRYSTLQNSDEIYELVGKKLVKKEK